MTDRHGRADSRYRCCRFGPRYWARKSCPAAADWPATWARSSPPAPSQSVMAGDPGTALVNFPPVTTHTAGLCDRQEPSAPYQSLLFQAESPVVTKKLRTARKTMVSLTRIITEDDQQRTISDLAVTGQLRRSPPPSNASTTAARTGRRADPGHRPRVTATPARHRHPATPAGPAPPAAMVI